MKSESNKSWIRELTEFFILLFVIIIPFRIYVAEPYIVSGISMSETYETGHYLIINKFWHKLSDIDRGDVLVFRSPNDDNKFYIKRVIGLPGETVSISNTVVTISPEDGSDPFVLEEPYIKNPTYAEVSLTLSEQEYFMMGDNRENSYDSRAWGPLNETAIRGEPVMRLFPFTDINLLPGRYQQY